jgi:hypothetical protein
VTELPESEAMTDWIDDWICATRADSEAGRRLLRRGVTESKTEERIEFGRMPTNCEKMGQETRLLSQRARDAPARESC